MVSGPRRARARLIYHPDLSQSRRLASVSLKARALWPALFAACDDQGRCSGDGASIKDQAVPLWDDITVADVEQALQELERVRLILRYASSQGTFLQIPDWMRWQGGLPVKNPSPYPPPTGWRDPEGRGWRDRVTAKLTTGKYADRLSAYEQVLCPNCEHTVAPDPYGGPDPYGRPGRRGWLCPRCVVELLGRKSPRPKIGGLRRRRTQRARDQILDALRKAPEKWWTRHELAEATELPDKTVANIMTALNKEGQVSVKRGKKPQDPSRYRHVVPQAPRV